MSRERSTKRYRLVSPYYTMISLIPSDLSSKEALPKTRDLEGEIERVKAEVSDYISDESC
jgi:hypothetical protein